MIIDVSIEKMNHLAEVLACAGVDGIFLPGDRMEPEQWGPTATRVRAAGKKAYFALPFVMRMDTELYYEQHSEALREAAFDGFLVRSLDGAALLMSLGLAGIRFFDQGMYVWNRRAGEQMRALGADVLTAPYECRLEELEAVGLNDTQMVIYGKLPMMISAQCTRKTTGKCRLTQGMRRDEAAGTVEFISLRDRKKAEFSEDSHCRFCYSVIYNSVPLWLVDRVPASCDRVRFSFTDEAEGVPSRILTSCIAGTDDIRIRKQDPVGEFTRGHLKRGVE